MDRIRARGLRLLGCGDARPPDRVQSGPHGSTDEHPALVSNTCEFRARPASVDWIVPLRQLLLPYPFTQKIVSDETHSSNARFRYRRTSFDDSFGGSHWRWSFWWRG